MIPPVLATNQQIEFYGIMDTRSVSNSILNKGLGLINYLWLVKESFSNKLLFGQL